MADSINITPEFDESDSGSSRMPSASSELQRKLIELEQKSTELSQKRDKLELSLTDEYGNKVNNKKNERELKQVEKQLKQIDKEIEQIDKIELSSSTQRKKKKSWETPVQETQMGNAMSFLNDLLNDPNVPKIQPAINPDEEFAKTIIGSAMEAAKNQPINAIVAEHAGDDPEKARNLRKLLSQARDNENISINEHNTALDDLFSNFGGSPTKLAKQLSSGIDYDAIKRFDEMAEYANNNFPHILSSFRGRTAEDRLAEFIKTGKRKKYRSNDPNVVEAALAMLGEGGDNDSGEYIPPAGGDPWDNDPFEPASGGAGNNEPPQPPAPPGGMDDGVPDDDDDIPPPVNVDDNPIDSSAPDDFDAAAHALRQNKEYKKRLKEAQKEEDKKHRQRVAEERKRINREHQDLMEKLRQEKALDSQLASEQFQNIKASTANKKIEAYSFGASVGIPGYLASVAADALFIGPQEEAEKNIFKSYRQRLAAYHAAMKQQAIEANRARLDELGAQQAPQVTGFDEEGNPIFFNPSVGSPGSGSGPTNAGTPGAGTPVGGGGNQPPPIPPGTPGTPTPGGPTPPGGGLPTKPTPPNIPIPSGSGNGILAVVGTVIKTLQVLDKVTEDAARKVNQFLIQGVSGDGIGASKSFMRATKALDPLGVNIPLTVAVAGFETLLDLNKAMLEAIRPSMAFMPNSIEAQVQGDIARLLQQMEIAQRTDPIVSELIRANTKFDMAWEEFKAAVIQEFGPTIIGLLEIVRIHVLALSSAVNFVDIIPGIGSIKGILDGIAGLIKKNGNQIPGVDAKLAKDIENFFNVNNNIPAAQIPKRGRR